ncbi:MAG TPA: NAD-dependent epimerase/dehydratase family protein [Candidatus Binatia bacterium]|nr:NAD-dependent epimerase/dehydratase family protein [Candidatus Binatia bacterium]
MARSCDSIVLLGRGALSRDVTRHLAAQAGDRRIVTVSTVLPVAPGEHAIDPLASGASRLLADVLIEARPSMVALLCLSESPQTPERPWLHDRAITDMVVSAAGRAAEAGVKIGALLALSSTAVYGVASKSPLLFHEQSACTATPSPSPCQRWADGLRASEQALLALRVAHRIRVCILRAAAPLGGPIDSTLEALLRASFPVRVLGYDPPVQSLAYEDLVQAVVLAIGQRSDEILNVVGRSIVPLSRLLALAGVFAPALPGAVADRVAPAALDGARLRWRTIADGRRAMQVLGFRPEHGLEESLRARR